MEEYVSCVVASHGHNECFLKGGDGGARPRKEDKGTPLYQPIAPPQLQNASVMREDDAQVSWRSILFSPHPLLLPIEAIKLQLRLNLPLCSHNLIQNQSGNIHPHKTARLHCADKALYASSIIHSLSEFNVFEGDTWV